MEVHGYGVITSHLVAVFWQSSGVASGFIRETDMAVSLQGVASLPCPLGSPHKFDVLFINLGVIIEVSSIIFALLSLQLIIIF